MLYKQIASTLMSALLVHSALSSPLDKGHIPGKREIPSTHILHERQVSHSRHKWDRKSKVRSSTLLPMRIGLNQRNLEEGHNLLMERSNPLSPEFGKRMTAQEAIDFFAPSRESVEAVRDWLVAGGIEVSRISQSANKQWIQFDATTEEAETLLHTDFYYWQHSFSGSENIAANEYHIPVDVQKYIDYVTPGVRLRADPGLIKRAKRRNEARQHVQHRSIKAMATGLRAFQLAADNCTDSSSPFNTTVCDKFVTPECIFLQYEMPKGTKASEGNELGIFESLGDHFSKEDLDVYYSRFYPEIPNGTYPIEKNIDGAFGASKSTAAAGAESDLDFEAAQPLIWPQKTILFQTDDEFYELNETSADTRITGFFNNFFDAIDGSYCTFSAYNETGNCVTKDCLDPSYPDPNPGGYQGQLQCGVYEPTNVISISYGGGELDSPASYFKRQCAEIMKLGLQGTTVVIASGDYGVGGYPGDPTESGCNGKDENIFYPDGSATCPYVLAVGSTEFVKVSGNSSTPQYVETATNRFPSGGGFSNRYDTPYYQAEQVKNYFDSVTLDFTGYRNLSDMGHGVYRIGGRGYPDVAAIGDSYIIRAQGTWQKIGGTSLAAPVWAAVLNRINEERIADGKNPLGFVNPILYAHPEVFNDITTGSNPNCNSTGFLATKGWDPVTGLGSPIYPKLLKLLQNLP